jgi:peptidoglycan/xylan/chitin deacetylase (PgdA/CDA1 family)
MRAVAVLVGSIALATGCGAATKRSEPVSQTTATAKQRPQPVFVTPHTSPVPILEYHVIGDPPANAPFPELYVGRAAFATQLSWLHAHGFHAVTLGRAYDYWRRGLALPRRPVVLSFDDGYRGQRTNAAPLLLRYRWPGVLNLAVQNVLDRKLTLPQLRTMVGDGWEINAHTMTHPDLTTLRAPDLRYQVAGSRRWIRRHLGVRAAFFCYPSGRYDAATLAAVRAAGFLGATTENQGFASPRDGFWTLDRVRVNRSDSLAAFAQKLGG